jgi:N-acylneuraminate cytidylyltransferase/CMP-N,N'-diacetyllegionaminic acid synthase
MSDTDRILVTICARGGSKGVPNKNLREVAGEPLIAHTIRQACEWPRDPDIVVSTDSADIESVALEHEVAVPFRRPPELAADSAGKLPVIQHAHQRLERDRQIKYDYVVDLDVTAPIRLVEDIESCYQAVEGTAAENAYTVVPADKNPYFNMVELDESGFAHLSKQTDEGLVRRQATPDVFAMNASVYVYERDYLVAANSIHGPKTAVSEMPPERSVDIDRPMDLAFVTFLMEEWGVDFD